MSSAALQQDQAIAIRMMALACGVMVGNIYLCQPLLDEMARSFGVAAHLAGFVAVGAQVGYAAGVLFVVPLADVAEPRRLVRWLIALTALGLLAAAAAPAVAVLIMLSLALAATTVVSQILIPLASSMVPPERRGWVIGALQTGLILGILLSRAISGTLASWSGSWRAPYLLAALLTGALLLVLPPHIPVRRQGPASHYLALLRSLPPLWQHRTLRLSAALGFCVFGAFSAFWATLAFHLASPVFGLGAAATGLFGLWGAPGALIAPLGGRLADRVGPNLVNLGSIIAVGLAFAVASTWGAASVLGLVLAANLLDGGMQAGQIANQARIFALGQDIRARLNTVYMVATFGGGAFGSFAGTLAWSWAGWRGVCGLGLVMVAAACTCLLTINRGTRPC